MVSVKDAAAVFDISERTLWRWIEGEILKVVRPPATKRTLVPRSEIERVFREALVDRPTPGSKTTKPNVKVRAEESGQDRMKRFSAQARRRVAIQTRLLRAIAYFDDAGEVGNG